ncbi:hypothetical protein [Streptomyces sp. NPDC058695]|uniref:hypothetical protein n=1 Tax=Streptomyces sp. NPDC058695 TaxID=3346604 RepID=UPI00364E342D
MHDIVDKFGSDPELLKHNGDSGESGPLHAMKGSLGDIAVDQLSARTPKSAAARMIAYTDSPAVFITRCTAQDVVEEDISTVIRVFEPGHKDESALKNLITEYAAALKRGSPCEAKAG